MKTPILTCAHCGRKIGGGKGNLLQHERACVRRCAVEGCPRPVAFRAGGGLCWPHWQRWRRRGSPLPDQPIQRHHGMAGTPTWISWSAARDRCRNPNNPAYHNYGGRGITFSKRWDNFQVFFADMGERPAGTTLDRRDNNGDYEVGNCRWATDAEQAQNKRRGGYPLGRPRQMIPLGYRYKKRDIDPSRLLGVSRIGPRYRTVIAWDPCPYCGSSPPGQVDHIHPQALGGPDCWWNFSASCERCNRQKHDDSLLGFLLWRRTAADPDERGPRE